MEKDKNMSGVKRKVPAITLPENEAINYALVLARNPHGENTAFPGIMDLAIPVSEVWTKDKPHASLSQRNIFVHNLMALVLAELPAGALHYCNKKPRVQDSGQSLSSSMRGGGKGLARRYGLMFRLAKIARIRLPRICC